MMTDEFRVIMKLWQITRQEKKHSFVILAILMCLSALAEMVSIGSFIPFISVISDPSLTGAGGLSQIINERLNLGYKEMVILCSLLFVSAITASGMFRLLVLRKSSKFAYEFGAELGTSVYRNTLSLPYEMAVNKNSSEVVSAISTKVSTVVNSVVLAGLTIITNGMLLIGIIAAMLTINSALTIGLVVVFGSIYYLLIRKLKNRLEEIGLKISRQSDECIKSLQEGMGGIKEIKIDGLEEVFLKRFESADVLLKNSQADSVFYSQAPRYLVESIAIVLMVAIALVYTMLGGDIQSQIPTIGAVALAVQKGVPSLQLIYSSISYFKSGKRSLEDVLNYFECSDYKKNINNDVLEFKDSIELMNVSFSYLNTNIDVVKDFSIKIQRGEKIGVIGETGAGKTTLINMLMGLFPPKSGSIALDGKLIEGGLNLAGYRRMISHVPQNIFLLDGSIAENIAFGLAKNEIDYKLVDSVIDSSSLREFIEGLPDGLDTRVGERGVKLSGGQKQRIGIARALYKKSKIIFFDEATSALDSETENNIMHAIELLPHDTTVVIIAHRISTLKGCGKIINIKKDKTYSTLKYDEI